MQWELSWDNQVVAQDRYINLDTSRETIQKSIPTEYLRGQTAGLFRSGREEPKRKCEVGDMFEMEGYAWVVVETDGVEVKYRMMDTEGEGLDSNL
jgi:hypothetical protein